MLDDNVMMWLTKEKAKFDWVAVLRVLVMENLRVQGLEMVIHCEIQKEQKLVEEKVLMVKCWMSELLPEANLGGLHWESHWEKHLEQKLELREVPLTDYQERRLMENVRAPEWWGHW